MGETFFNLPHHVLIELDCIIRVQPSLQHDLCPARILELADLCQDLLHGHLVWRNGARARMVRAECAAGFTDIGKIHYAVYDKAHGIIIVFHPAARVCKRAEFRHGHGEESYSLAFCYALTRKYLFLKVGCICHSHANSSLSTLSSTPAPCASL